jgi:hypothetical protein
MGSILSRTFAVIVTLGLQTSDDASSEPFDVEDVAKCAILVAPLDHAQVSARIRAFLKNEAYVRVLKGSVLVQPRPQLFTRVVGGTTVVHRRFSSFEKLGEMNARPDEVDLDTESIPTGDPRVSQK